MPFAVVEGQPFTEMPTDLYIPPDALEVILEAFEGPLDLLLYLIKRQNLDILNIPIFSITRQYVKYIELMHQLNFELAAEYLVMAAMLAEIKSRMLLPRPVFTDDEEADPRAELIRRLQEYERFKQAAEDIDELPRQYRDFWPVIIHSETAVAEQQIETVDIRELVLALQAVMARAELKTSHAISREVLSVKDRMASIMRLLQPGKTTRFEDLFTPEEGKQGALVSFLAVLELLKAHALELVQNQPFGPIYLNLATE
ncbi:MAG: segregation/condensation protein A [Proteobacteria bacterium]|nr:MAG: segregation/condensation protein A [Pseudomonadota bacterium]